MTLSSRPTIVIVGAGFAGLQTAISLGGAKATVYLIDRNAYHTFVPLLYQVATGTLVPRHIARSVRSLVRRHRNIQCLQAEVESINLDSRQVYTQNQILTYDYLVIATGSETTFYDVPGAAQYAKPMRTLQDAIALRQHIFDCFEQAHIEPDPTVRQQKMSVAIVGGGATGVELAGALAELIQGPISATYTGLACTQARIDLIQSGSDLLAEFAPSLGRYAARSLARQQVNVHLNSRARAVTEHRIELSDGQVIHAETVIWAVGVQGQLPKSFQSWPLTSRQQLEILPTLQLRHYPQVYAIGDIAEVYSQGHRLSGVAPEALQQGVRAARNLRRQIKGRSPKPFHYFNKGRLAIIGHYRGVGKIGPFHLKGFFPWLLWLAVHLVYLPGYLSRMRVLRCWLRAYGWRADANVAVTQSPRQISER